LKEKSKHISVVIPVYNSENCLDELYSKISDALKTLSYEIIFINDGSTDGSWQKINSIAERDNQVKGICFSRNFGQNHAILAGLKNCSGEVAVIMDDDLQHDPKDILSLVNECENGYDVCFALFDNLKQKGWKNAGSNLNGKIAEWFINKPKEIYLSPFKALRRNVIDRISQYKGSYPYIDVMILQSTSSFTQIKVQHHQRFEGKGNFTFKKSLVVFLSHLFSYSVFPLKMLTWIGVLSALLSFGLGIFYLTEYFVNGYHVEGWITLTLLLLFFGGLILFALGIIGSYISRIYQSGNFPEPYSIREKKNF
jgi:undecaprenyl-phosphate 4-deoxy-4-formamido-L-arabinose transferase